MTNHFKWKEYTVIITKKKNMKRMIFRIKPEMPLVIYISIPYTVTYDKALQELDTPKFLQWLDENQKNISKTPDVKKDWYEEHKFQKALYIERLQVQLPHLVKKWESKLGVSVNKVTVRDTRSQWGSCNVRNHNISISVWLGAYPPECVEYIVVHELTHLLEPKHNARFYGFLDHFYPDWRKCEEQLKKKIV